MELIKEARRNIQTEILRKKMRKKDEGEMEVKESVGERTRTAYSLSLGSSWSKIAEGKKVENERKIKVSAEKNRKHTKQKMVRARDKLGLWYRLQGHMIAISSTGFCYFVRLILRFETW